MHNDNSTLRDLLRQCKTIAVVGLSAEWHRPSFFAAKYMQSHGYKIIPVNPRYAATDQQILGEKVYASLLDIPQPVDMVDTAIMYQMGDKQFVNGDPGADSTYLSSAEIHACKDKTALTDIIATSLRLQHGGKFV